jgi:hypothetical protein
MRCSARNKAGSPCGAAAMRGRDTCHMHSARDKAATLGAAGGRRRAIARSSDLRRFRPPSSAEDVQQLLGQTIIDVRTGDLDPRAGNTTAFLAGAFLKAFETGKLEDRVRRLEQRKDTRR